MISNPTKESRWVQNLFDFPLDDDLSLADSIMVQEHIEQCCVEWIDSIATGNHQLVGLDTTVLPALFQERLNEARRVLADLRSADY